MLQKKEYENLSNEFKAMFNCEKFMNGYRAKGKQCSFLGNNGCVIPQEYRFIECKLFPLEIAALDKLIINLSAEENCIGLRMFTTEDCYKKGYELLDEYISNGLLTQEDVDSILNNKYEL
jgi:hypothetical protein